MSSHNRADEDERLQIDEQLRDYAEIAAENARRRQQEQEELARRRLQREEASEQLFLEFAAKTPPEFHGWLRTFLADASVNDSAAGIADRPAGFSDVRFSFLKAMARQPDDATTRLVYADWLDEQGEHEEADRQRKWPAAREWFDRLCQANANYEGVTQKALLDFGRRVLASDTPDYVSLSSNEDLWHTLRGQHEDFWANWSILTGLALPPNLEGRGFHRSECCAHEVYHYFGAPEPVYDEVAYGDASTVDELTTTDSRIDEPVSDNSTVDGSTTNDSDAGESSAGESSAGESTGDE